MERINTLELRVPVKEIYQTIEVSLKQKYGVPETFVLEYMRFEAPDRNKEEASDDYRERKKTDSRYLLKFKDVRTE